MIDLLLKFITYLLVLLVFSSNGYSQDVTRSVLRDPSISLRCKALIRDRKEKLEIKQKTNALIQRNKKVTQLTPKNKKSVKLKLQSINNKLLQILKIKTLELRVIEEEIVKQGCPGVSL